MFKKDVLKDVFNNSPEVKIDDESKIVFISDCHRCDGTWKDELLPNKYIYMAALNYYYNNMFTQIEIGDGDDLWKIPSLADIYDIYADIYEILLRYKNANRFYMIFGNHDDIKGTKKFKRYIEKFKLDLKRKTLYDFFYNLPIYEGLILVHQPSGKKLFVVHGHQVDFMNYDLSFVNKFLVRYVWSFLEQVFGFKNPTSPAKSDSKSTKVDETLETWVKENNQPMIAGHTHRSIFPNKNESEYFNDGCCVQPYSISTIELVGGKLTLVKWSVTVVENGQMVVQRKEISNSRDIKDI